MRLYRPRARNVRELSGLEIAWLAGLLEGEGTFMLVQTHGRARGRIQVAMTDEDIIRRVAEVVGHGKARLLAERSYKVLGRKPIWFWSVQGVADVRYLCEVLRPWMGERRRTQIDRVLAVVTDPEPVPFEYVRRPPERPGFTRAMRDAKNVA